MNLHPRLTQITTVTRTACLAALLSAVMSACSYSGGDERIPTPARVGPPPSVEIIPGSWSPNPNLMVPRQARVLPRHLGLDDRERRLTRGHVNARGPVRALVLPLSFGAQEVAWTPERIGFHLIGSYGTSDPNRPMAVAPLLHEESQGLFRLDASVFPPVVHPERAPEGLFQDPESVRSLVYRTVRHWAGRVNLASYDSDGPDGIPMSGDDDGLLDLVIVTFETDHQSGVTYLDTDLLVPVGRHGDMSLGLGRVMAVGLPRSRSEEQMDRSGAMLVLSAMGLSYGEMFFPDHYPHQISTLARMRLGWLRGAWTETSGIYTVADGTALVAPVMDVPDGRAFWLIERSGDSALITRAARKREGGFGVVSRSMHSLDDPDAILSLTQTEGTLGPRVRVTWEAGALKAYVALTHRAALEDDPPGAR